MCVISHVWLFAVPWTVATELLCPWDFPGKNTGHCCHFLLQGIFLTQGSNLHLLYWQGDSLPLSHLGSPIIWIPSLTFTQVNQQEATENSYSELGLYSQIDKDSNSDSFCFFNCELFFLSLMILGYLTFLSLSFLVSWMKIITCALGVN